MSLVSLKFIIFVLLTVLIYFLAPKGYRWCVLLVSSIIFYVSNAGIVALLEVAITVLVAYFGAKWIAKDRDNQKKIKLYLIVSVIALIGILTIFKILNYAELSFEFIIMPLGISYYTFSLVGYVADVYWKKEEVENSYLKLLLFALYFPKILEGPISKHRNIASQLNDGNDYDYKQLCYGIQLAIYGYFKKLVIANRAGALADAVYAEYSQHGGALLFVMMIVQALRMYCDFSGCMDIIIGVSECMGIKIEANFKRPFFSKSAAEFWRRWHITLGVWFKDYVYMPLVISPVVINISKWTKDHIGKRAGKSVLTIIPLGVVWVLTGLWHGTGLSYIVWGLYWGTIIILSAVFATEIKKFTKFLRINTEAPTWKLFQMIRTSLLFCFGHVISRRGVEVASYTLKALLFNVKLREISVSTLTRLNYKLIDMLPLAFGVIVLLTVSIMQEKMSVREWISSWNALPRWVFYAASILLVLVIGAFGAEYDASTFAYANF